MANASFDDLNKNLTSTNKAGGNKQSPAFVSATSMASVEEYSKPSASLEGMDKTELSLLASRSGLDSIENASDLNKALNNIANEANESANAASNFASEQANAATVWGQGSLGVIPDVTMNMQDKMLSLQGTSSGLLDSFGGALKSVTDPIKANSQAVLGTLGKVDSSVSSMLDTLPRGVSAYNGLIDNMGNMVTGEIYGTVGLPFATIQKLNYTAKRLLCSNVLDMGNWNDFSVLKDLYDLLCALAGANGLWGLLKSLLDCDANIPYRDSRTFDTLAAQIDSAAYKGDVQTLIMIADHAGTGRFTTPQHTVTTCAANMEPTDENRVQLQDLSNRLGIDYNSLTKSPTGNESAGTLAAMYHTQPESVLSLYGDTRRDEMQENVNTAITVMQAYTPSGDNVLQGAM